MDGYRISDHFAQRLKATVLRVDAMPLSSGAGKIPVRLEDRQTWSSGGSPIVEAYFTGGWVKGAEKQVVFLANTATTATAVNLIRTIPISSGQTARNCTITLRSVQPSTGEQKYVLLNSEC